MTLHAKSTEAKKSLRKLHTKPKTKVGLLPGPLILTLLWSLSFDFVAGGGGGRQHIYRHLT